eukprot:s332_g12.t1
MKWTYILTQTEEVLKSVASDCLFGVLTVLLQSLPAIDCEKGRSDTGRCYEANSCDNMRSHVHEALEVLEITEDLVAILDEQADRTEIRSAAFATGWDVAALLRTAKLYGRVLRPRTAETCRLKIYVYPAPKMGRTATRSL